MEELLKPPWKLAGHPPPPPEADLDKIIGVKSPKPKIFLKIRAIYGLCRRMIFNAIHWCNGAESALFKENQRKIITQF